MKTKQEENKARPGRRKVLGAAVRVASGLVGAALVIDGGKTAHAG